MQNKILISLKALTVLLAFSFIRLVSAQTIVACPAMVYPYPDTPVNIVAVPGDQSAVISFDVGTNSCIFKGSNFTVKSSNGTYSASGTTSPIKITGLKNGEAYTFTVQACGGSASATSCSQSVASNKIIPSASSSISLKAGWNLIGNSVSDPIGVNGLFNNPGSITSVWKWNASNNKWAFYSPLLADGGAAYAESKGYELLTRIYGGEGFWVNASQNTSIKTEGGSFIQSTFTQQGKPGEMRRGWNLLSIGESVTPSNFNSNIGNSPPSAGSVPANITSLWAWDNDNAKWYFYAPELEAKGGTALVDYIASKGYLDFGLNGKRLGSGVGFWVNYPTSSEIESIDSLIKTFLSSLSSCDNTSIPTIKGLFSTNYVNGKTVQDFLSEVCNAKLGTLIPQNIKAIAIGADKAVFVFSISGKLIETETAFGFTKINGQWKLMGDPLQAALDDPKVRHELILNLNDGASSSERAKFNYQRYIDFWTDRSSYTNVSAADSIEFFIYSPSEASYAWNMKSPPTTPDVKLYLAPSGCNNLYTLDSARKDCNTFAYESSFPSAFAKLESNQYSVYLYKYKDSNGNCLNCDPSNGMPLGGGVLGNAKTFAQIFGTEINPEQLASNSGIAVDALSASVKSNFRRYFGMPTDSQIQTLTNLLLSKTITSTISVPWVRSTAFNSPVDGIWGGSISCGSNGAYVSFSNDHVFPSDSTSTLVYNNPSSKTFTNAGYISFTLATKINISEFTFQTRVFRGNSCAQ